MALPDYTKLELGTAVVWGQPSATGVTKNLSVNGLANGSAREGAFADLGATFDEEYYLFLIVESGTAPAAATTVELFMACSYDGSTWPAKVTGADAAWPATGTLADVKRQLGSPVAILSATAELNTIQRQQPTIWRPGARYVAPVLYNNLGQAIRSHATAADNATRVILVPRRYLLQDAA
jgi:hypothetical protein